MDSISSQGNCGERVTTESLVMAIVDELAAARGVDPLSLPPLYDHVDLDSLSSFVDLARTHPDHLFDVVSFTLDDDEIRIHHDGTVEVRPVTATADARPTPNLVD